MIGALILIPVLGSLLVLAVDSDRARRRVLLAAALAHSALTAAAWWRSPAPLLGWLELDALGLLFLGIVSLLFLASAVYAVSYLERQTGHRDQSEAVFIACLLAFLASMTLAVSSLHMTLLWVGVEATTLSSAPLIYFHRDSRSLEATWKYLLICSVGIALALLGTFFLVVSAGRDAGLSLMVPELRAQAATLNPAWLKAAFVLLLVGYGTKMGLAPMHTWLPDAHSEAPSPVSALLSAALLNCAFLGILRAYQILGGAGLDGFARDLLVLFGLLSMAVAAVFLLHPVGFKRMLAYSSVEHMGILALGVGLGGAGVAGAMFHAVNHSLTKGMLFMVAGNLLAEYGTKEVNGVRGALRRMPVSGALWIVGLLAITGSPPFGTFLSEFTILSAAIGPGRWLVAGAFLALLGLAFVGMAGAFLRMAQGDSMGEPAVRERPGSVVPAMVLGVLVLALGLYVPDFLQHALAGAAAELGVAP